MWAMAAADVACPELFSSDEFAAFLGAKEHSRRWGAVELSQLHQWQLWCDERGFDRRDVVALPAELRARGLDAFRSQPQSPSLLQRQVLEALEAIDLRPQAEVTINEGYSLDMLVEYGGVSIAVEVDGPSHFLGDSEVPTGATLLKRRQLRSLGWAVLPVPYFALPPGAEDGVYTQAYRAMDLREALEALAHPAHEAYALLSLEPGSATMADVKRAYRQSLLAHHPDRNVGDTAAEARTRAVIRAYERIQDDMATGASMTIEGAWGETSRERERAAPFLMALVHVALRHSLLPSWAVVATSEVERVLAPREMMPRLSVEMRSVLEGMERHGDFLLMPVLRPRLPFVPRFAMPLLLPLIPLFGLWVGLGVIEGSYQLGNRVAPDTFPELPGTGPFVWRTLQSLLSYPHFLPSNEFRGARPGFVFKNGPLGVGYYRDTPLPSGPPSPQDACIAIEPVVVGANLTTED